jgi:hypothetical protein
LDNTRKPSDRFHGRVGNGTARCAYPGCTDAGEFRAPASYGRLPGSNGPGEYQLLCLDHVREFNAGYDWFAGMTRDEIIAAQSPTYTWPNETRAFSATAGVDSPPKWSDFHDPLETISARFRGRINDAAPRRRADGNLLQPADRRALRTLGLGEDADRKGLRRRYSELVRKYHPDKNGGNRAHEKALQDVIAAYTHLKNIPAFA